MQTFSEVRSKNYVYVDKTEYVYRMTHSDSKYIFMSRPRRFGKSLGKHMDHEQLDRYLASQLNGHETLYGIDNHQVDVNLRLTTLIKHTYEQTGRPVVVLIDEYDAPYST